MSTIDINCDMGEGYGPWKMGDDPAIMPHITSANIACGAHAGDPDVMLATIRLAKRHGVATGAHPGYFDLRNFGRRPLHLSPDEVLAMLSYQLGAFYGVARAEHAEVSHVKPHGALYNQACADPELARAIIDAVVRFSSSVPLLGLPASELETAALSAGLPFLREGFADRAYEPNGSLRDRKYADSLIAEPDRAGMNAVSIARGSVSAVDGTTLSLDVDTLCVHGDTRGAPAIAASVRGALENAGFTVAHVTP